MSEQYRAPTGAAEAELRERGSRFLACLRPVRDEGEAEGVLAELPAAHRGARHLCWAWTRGEPKLRASLAALGVALRHGDHRSSS